MFEHSNPTYCKSCAMFSIHSLLLCGCLNCRRDEAKFIQEFIVEVSSKLGVATFEILEDFFGMDSRMEKLNLCVSPSPYDVRFVGICGIGKTALTRAYYEWMHGQFEGSSFLANVREVCENNQNGLENLQALLLSDIWSIYEVQGCS